MGGQHWFDPLVATAQSPEILPRGSNIRCSVSLQSPVTLILTSLRGLHGAPGPCVSEKAPVVLEDATAGGTPPLVGRRSGGGGQGVHRQGFSHPVGELHTDEVVCAPVIFIFFLPVLLQRCHTAAELRLLLNGEERGGSEESALWLGTARLPCQGHPVSCRLSTRRTFPCAVILLLVVRGCFSQEPR